MDYYEELGIQRTATEEEIRRAHRRLTKLLHPDQQTDEAMKQLAETQMRRLNSIVEILYNPEQRRLYDEHLRRGVPFTPGAPNARTQTQRRPGQALPWMATTLAAVALTLAAVWFWANNWGSSFGNRNPTYIPSEATAEVPPAKPAANPAPAQLRQSDPRQTASPAGAPPQQETATLGQPQPPQENEPILGAPSARAKTPADPTSLTIAAVPTASKASKKAVAVTASAALQKPQARKKLKLLPADVSAEVRPVELDVPPPPNVSADSGSHLDAAAIPAVSMPGIAASIPGPPPKGRNAKSGAANSSHPKSLEGEWVYAPTEPEKRKPGFYPPEFIDLKLFSKDGALHGQYKARYQVTDRPIPPDVDFTLAPDIGANKFVWKSSNGSKGTLKISSIDAASIRIEWRTTVFSNSPALTAGTATLVKRQ